MKVLSFRILLAGIGLVIGGCTSLLPNSSAISPSPFASFESARQALEKTVPYQTTLEELKALGFDPNVSANVTFIPYPEVVSRLAPYSGVPIEALDRGVRDCILAQTQCSAYLYRFGRTDRQRDGNFLLDFFNIKRNVQLNGWRFEGLVVVRDGVVIFRNSAGEPNLNASEKTNNPLGPFQRSGESSDLLLR